MPLDICQGLTYYDPHRAIVKWGKYAESTKVSPRTTACSPHRPKVKFPIMTEYPQYGKGDSVDGTSESPSEEVEFGTPDEASTSSSPNVDYTVHAPYTSYDIPLEPDHHVPPPVPPAPTPLKPVQEKERYTSLDVVRGMAVFGILFVNIQDFSMVTGARYGYWISGGTDEINKAIWTATFVLFDTKFIAIFTMLFGASIALYSDKRKETGRKVWGIYYSRMFALVLIGGLHTFLLWDGDILYDYAVFGLILYLVPRFHIAILILISALFISLNGVDMAHSLPLIRPGYEYHLVDILRGSWQNQFDWRWLNWQRDIIRIPMYFLFQAIGHMTLGMVLLRIKFLSGKWPTWSYWIIGITGMSAGLFLTHQGSAFRFDFTTLRAGYDFYWGSLLMSFGWMGLAIGASKSLWILWPVRALASAGRMALSNYLMQTLICTTIFYGYGFGMFERMDRTGLLALVLSIIVFELILSSYWLKHFRFGPIEWVWRTMTYRKFQPMLHHPEPESEITTDDSFDAELDTVEPLLDLGTGDELEADERMSGLAPENESRPDESSIDPTPDDDTNISEPIDDSRTARSTVPQSIPPSRGDQGGC